MPSFFIEATVFSLEDSGKTDNLVNQFKLIEMRKAVAAYLRAALKRIPIRTGFLKGAFADLNRAFRAGDSGAELNPALAALFNPETKELVESRIKAKDSKLTDVGRARRIELLRQDIHQKFRQQKKKGQHPKDRRFAEYYRPSKGKKILKNARNALRNGLVTSPDDVIVQSGNIVTAHINIDIIYYRVNDFYSRIKGAPWNSIKEGTNAAIASLEKSVNRFPKLSELLTRIRISLKDQTMSINKISPPEGLVASRLLRITGFE